MHGVSGGGSAAVGQGASRFRIVILAARLTLAARIALGEGLGGGAARGGADVHGHLGVLALRQSLRMLSPMPCSWRSTSGSTP
jgi:hypothetical protein